LYWSDDVKALKERAWVGYLTLTRPTSPCHNNTTCMHRTTDK